MRGVGLQGELERLRGEADAQRRGYGLEALLERLFRAGHFDVTRDPKGARPRQVKRSILIVWGALSRP